MKKILFMTGSHPRHAAVARELYKTGMLAGLVIENREEHTPVAPNDISDNLVKLFNHHFQKRAESEQRFFSNPDFPEVKTLHTSLEKLNSVETQNFIREAEPDLLLSYGVHMLTNETLACASGETWNIHGGLSPWYRGCITHFWPSYMLEPQMTGMTIHNLTQQLDAGDVVHQNVAPLVKGDGLHDLACRAVQGMIDDMLKLSSALEGEKEILKKSHKTTGKLWIANDWRPAHLRLIYDTYNDQIVDAYLNGDLGKREIKLHRQF